MVGRVGWAAGTALCVLSAAGFALAKGGAAGSGNGMPQKINDTVELAGTWIYDDADKAFDEAKKQSKPICFVFR